jgi:type I restriction enzyme R subunit
MRDALPNAAFVGYTGTPVSATDRNTRYVFGDYIDVYDIQRAVEDEATVPIYYDARHAKIGLDEKMIPRLDPDFEEVTEGEEQELKERLKTKWARMAAIVGDPDRVALVAKDIVEHYEQRDAVLPGKAMIVCMTREICVKMYDALLKLRPGWHHPDDDKGMLKVVMTGSAADGPDWQPHIRNRRRRKELAERFRDPDTGFKIVIVRDMWLTGFDAPSLHTMYADKPMRGLSLMQAIARVNRVFPGKDGGLVVAYLPLATQLQEALKDYTAGDREHTGRLQDEAAEIMMEKYDVVKTMFHGFDYSNFFTASPTARLTTLSAAVEHILDGREENRDRYVNAVTTLGRAYALANPHEKAIGIRDEVGFFQAVKAPLVKTTTTAPTRTGKTPQELDAAIQQIVTKAVAPEGIVDLLSLLDLTGLGKPRHLHPVR